MSFQQMVAFAAAGTVLFLLGRFVMSYVLPNTVNPRGVLTGDLYRAALLSCVLSLSSACFVLAFPRLAHRFFYPIISVMFLAVVGAISSCVIGIMRQRSRGLARTGELHPPDRRPWPPPPQR
jgi:hypothetical protein